MDMNETQDFIEECKNNDALKEIKGKLPRRERTITKVEDMKFLSPSIEWWLLVWVINYDIFFFFEVFLYFLNIFSV